MSDRVEGVRSHPVYVKEMQECAEAEKDRIFCGHDAEHALAVARICYILVLENQIPVSRDVVYAAALLHDIGRNTEYRTGESHRTAGPRIAMQILTDVGYVRGEQEIIRSLIVNHSGHRKAAELDGRVHDLQDAFDLADYWSRDCAACAAEKECNWEKKHVVLNR